MLDHDLIRRTLGTALRTGGELAEIFVEDRTSSNAVFDDGKVEQVTSGRDRGAGIRVVHGETTGFAHTADLTEAGLLAAAEAAAMPGASHHMFCHVFWPSRGPPGGPGKPTYAGNIINQPGVIGCV